MTDQRLWAPSAEAIERTQLSAFRRVAEGVAGRPLADYEALHTWSVDDRETFWTTLWDFCGVIGERGERVLQGGDRMPGARWFPDARLNFAENLLGHPGTGLALISACVYGCFGDANKSFTVAISTILPRYITATRSAMCCTTFKSCDIKR